MGICYVFGDVLTHEVADRVIIWRGAGWGCGLSLRMMTYPYSEFFWESRR